MKNEIKFIVSEWGYLIEFSNINDAIQYCYDNNLEDGEEGLLWVSSDNRESLDSLIKEHKDKEEFIFFKHIDTPHNWTWCSAFEEWEDATEMEKEGDEDFEQKQKERLEYIEQRYGENHGKLTSKQMIRNEQINKIIRE